MTKTVPEHKDKLGRILSLGECVAYPDGNVLLLGTIVKLNPKMLKIKPLSKSWEVNKYPNDTLKVDAPDLTWYLLKK
jgi:hypothetical protein